jgi:hypothetical protein
VMPHLVYSSFGAGTGNDNSAVGRCGRRRWRVWAAGAAGAAGTGAGDGFRTGTAQVLQDLQSVPLGRLLPLLMVTSCTRPLPFSADSSWRPELARGCEPDGPPNAVPDSTTGMPSNSCALLSLKWRSRSNFRAGAQSVAARWSGAHLTLVLPVPVATSTLQCAAVEQWCARPLAFRARRCSHLQAADTVLGVHLSWYARPQLRRAWPGNTRHGGTEAHAPRGAHR